MAGTPGRPRSLTLDQIAQAVLDDGLSHFSMPSVARRIGVAHSALYRYVEDRDDLLVLALERAATTVDLPSAGQHWDALLRALGEHAWSVCDAFPGFDRAVLTATRPSAFWTERFTEFVASMTSQGFTDDDAAILIDLVIRLALASSMEAARLADASSGRAMYARQLDVVLAGAATLPG